MLLRCANLNRASMSVAWVSHAVQCLPTLVTLCCAMPAYLGYAVLCNACGPWLRYAVLVCTVLLYELMCQRRCYAACALVPLGCGMAHICACFEAVVRGYSLGRSLAEYCGTTV